MSEPTSTWTTIVAKKQAERASKIPPEWILKSPPSEDVVNVMNVPYECGIMTENELSLTEKDATELIGLLAKQEITSYELTLAFCKRAAIAQQLLNCLTEIFFDEALERAKELDDIIKRTGKPVGPYHGLPFSIKDQFQIKGKDTSAGFVSWVGNIAAEDAGVVDVLRKAGAVFYVKTNNPQTLMHLETNSNIFGRTLNPFNRKLSPGGSSGGEGALVGFRGSPIGLGSDGGGSIRVPAGCVGAYGHRITDHRISLEGCALPNTGCESSPVVPGPICRSARDNEYFFKVMIESEPWTRDPAVIRNTWRTVPEPEKIKIGYFVDDKVVAPHAPVRRGMEKLIKTLSEDPKFELVEFEPLNHGVGYDIIRSLYYMDGGKKNWEAMDATGEPYLPLTEWVLKESHAKSLSMIEGWDLVHQRDVFRKEYLTHWNTKYPDVDFILCPWSHGVAPRHDTSRYWGYSAIWNILDYPSIVFPTGDTADPKIDTAINEQVRTNEFDADMQAVYSPSAYEFAPICAQLVSPKFYDEELFAALRVIERALGRTV